MFRIATLIGAALALALAPAWGQPASAATKMDFEAAAPLPAGWASQGDVAIDRETAFKGAQSLRLQRAAAAVEKPCAVTGTPFAVTPGVWKFDLAARSELTSPDSSFNGVVALEWLDGAGQVLASVTLADLYGQRNWQPVSRRLEAPEGAVAARFQVRLNKASGRFWVDELAAGFVAAVAKTDRRLDRILFATAQMGNLLFPEDQRTVAVSVVALKPLATTQRELSYVLRDYWGAECAAAGKVALGAARPDGKKLVYEAVIDLGAAPLETGRYYELHAEVAQPGDEPFRNYTSLAILPKPVTKNYQPEEIPFTSRNWEGNIGEFFHLADRLGVRISNVWSGWAATPPYTLTPGRMDLCEKLGMGVIAGCPTSAWERHAPGHEKYNDTALRQGVRNWLKAYGHVRPMFFSLGNEPPVLEDRLPANVAAYKSVYEEVKKLDPGVTVIATSVGPVEEFFKAGFHQYCDWVDFHAYSDWREIRGAFQEYDRLFAKYGHRKPVCSTEIGLNSQGLARQTVAAAMIKKITSFFACGGVSISWFDLGYPDPDLKLAEDSTTAHNVFDCRYARYCPKLDAIAYYNLINGICVKKPVADKLYDADTYAFLFRDRDGHCLQVLWKEKGRRDAFVPLPGVGKVTAIDIDGRRGELDAGGQGLTLTINEDPLLLLYDSATAPLAERLGAPAARLAALPEGVVKGGETTLEVLLAAGVPAEAVELTAPAAWEISKGSAASREAGVSTLPFRLHLPDSTAAREGDLRVRITDGKGGHCGELRARLPVTGRVAARLAPEPVIGDQPAGVRLILQNYANEKQEVAWRLALASEIPMLNGRADNRAPIVPTAYFAELAEGSKTLDAKGTAEIVVPLAGVDPLNVYRVKASVSDASGRAVTTERFMAGFLRVPHAKSAIKLDGSMAEPDWQTAPVANLNEARQYFAFGPEVKWKGPADLSGTVQFLWDEKCLYVGVKAADDVFANRNVDGDLWAGDGLQFLADPARDKADKPGKYDIAVAITKKGPQAWCYLSADAGAPSGEAKDIIVSAKRRNAGRGDISYVVAIPWSRLAPFKPAVGANLGLGVVLNEDDGGGRVAYLGWLCDVQTKQVDTVGDLILAP
ncbi:MAG: sugar-binding protein [Lentisphaeria bacterium]|jgi:hypothetical protein